MGDSYYVDPKEGLYSVSLEMDDDTWAAIQRGKDLTQEINLPLSRKELNLVQGPTDLEGLDEPDFGKQSTEPEAIASNQEEFDEMREAWRMGQELEGMILGGEGKGWSDMKRIMSEKINELRREQDSYTGSNRSTILDLAVRLRNFREAYDFFTNTVSELIRLPRPVLKQNEEKYPS